MTTTQKAIRILIVDDSTFFRKTLVEVIDKIPGVELAGTAVNGKDALEKIFRLQPDLMTLDYEMPEMNGLETLNRIRQKSLDIVVIMVSSHTKFDAELTIKALNAGAFDFITKPDSADAETNFNELLLQLSTKIHTVIARLRRHPVLTLQPDKTVPVSSQAPGKTDLVAIGISTGGPQALKLVLSQLPAQFTVPIVIVQHMPQFFTKALAESLDNACAVKVVEGHPGDRLAPGTVYLAPGAKQMKVLNTSHGYILDVNDDPPEKFCRPSVDYLFRSVAKACKNRALGIIMTGMGSDGTEGLRKMKEAGSLTIAQNPASATLYAMPLSAINAGVVDSILELEDIPSAIIKQTR